MAVRFEAAASESTVGRLQRAPAFTGTPYTVVAWFRFDDDIVSSSESFDFYSTDFSVDNWLELRQSNVLRVGTDNYVDSASDAWQDATWHCMAMTRSATTQTGYVLDRGVVLSRSTTSSAAFQVEALLGFLGDGSATGRAVTHYKCWTAALTHEELAREMQQFAPVRTADLVAYAKLEAHTDLSDEIAGSFSAVNATPTTVAGPTDVSEVWTGAYVASSATTNATTSSGGLACNMPSGIQAGDLLLASAANDTSVSWSASAGWDSIDNGANGSATQGATWAKIAAGGDTLTITGEANDIAIVVYRVVNHGVANVTTDIIKGTAATGTNNAPNPPNCNPAVSKKWLWIAHYASDDDDNTAQWWPADMAPVAQIKSATGTSSCMTGVAYRWLEASSYDPSAFALSASEEWRTQTFAIPPYVPPAPDGEPPTTYYGSWSGELGTGPGSSATFTPVANSLLVALAYVMESAGTTDPSGDMTISGGGLTWTSITSIGNAATWSAGIRVWAVDIGPSPSPMTVILDCGARNIAWGSLSVISVAGYDTSNPIGAVAYGGGTGSTGLGVDGPVSITLSEAPASSSVVLAYCSSTITEFIDNSMEAGSGWTELEDFGAGHLQKRHGSTSATVTWNDVDANASGTVQKTFAVAIEVRAAIEPIFGSFAATESGADTAALIGSGITTGELAATESGSDVAALAGVVENEIGGGGQFPIYGDVVASETGTDAAQIFGETASIAISGVVVATESGSDTATIAGKVVVFGLMSAVESGTDVGAFAGDVPVVGAFAATEAGADSALFTAGVVANGAFAVTEEGPDVVAFTGNVPVSGAFAATEAGTDAAAFAGTVPISGALEVAEEGADAAAFTGNVPVSGAFALIEDGSDTAFFTAGVVTTGALAATEQGSDAAAFTGQVPVTGAFSANEEGTDIAALTGNVPVAGALAATEEGHDTALISAGLITIGAFSLAESGSDTTVFLGRVPAAGALAANEEGVDTAAFTGNAPVKGALEASEGAVDSASFDGKVQVQGVFSATETGSDSLFITGSKVTSGVLVTTESDTPDIAAFTAKNVVSVVVASVESGDDTASFGGDVPVVGNITVIEFPDTVYIRAIRSPGTLNATEEGEDTAIFTGKIIRGVFGARGNGDQRRHHEQRVRRQLEQRSRRQREYRNRA